MPQGFDSSAVFPDPAPVFMHSSQNAAAQSLARKRCAEQNRVYHSFHYATARQARLWTRVFQEHSPVLKDVAFVNIYHETFSNLPYESLGKYVHVVGLGPGTGMKERWLLEELERRGIETRFTAVDVSPALCLQAGTTNAPLFGLHKGLMVCCDLLAFRDLANWLDFHDAGCQRIYTFFGLFPNFMPQDAFGYLHDLLRSDDLLLASAHLAPGVSEDDNVYKAGVQAILPQYDNCEMLEWLSVVLQDWGWAPHLEPLRIEPALFADDLRGIRAFTAWNDDVELDWEDGKMAKPAGQVLEVFYSLRYTPKRFEAQLKQYDLRSWLRLITPCREEGVWIMQRIH